MHEGPATLELTHASLEDPGEEDFKKQKPSKLHLSRLVSALLELKRERQGKMAFQNDNPVRLPADLRLTLLWQPPSTPPCPAACCS